MRKLAHSCAQFEAAAGLMARRWTPLILRALHGGPVRYCLLAENLEQISERMLLQRLREMKDAGLVVRNVFPDDQPARVEYGLTEKGESLAKVVGVLERWAEQWIPATATATATR
ncbi:MAG: helix-turn-helix transcriptional regulator [Deltaproteobacteria bacterium]|nr:MAG: helix-turn-helix transcriptional regulator [Deltaproteobacteria bacterium]